MCGIGGILKITRPGEKHEPIPETWLDAIDEEIKWRGPDGAGRFRDCVTLDSGITAEVALVHRRLSIIDIEGGAQPMTSGDCPACRRAIEKRVTRWKGVRSTGAIGPVCVAFNGCIYNHAKLREELIQRGHRFVTDHSDTEVLVHGYAEWSVCVRLWMDAMCAAAVWDPSFGRIDLVRDALEEKPLFAGRLPLRGASGAAFASSAVALESLRRVAGSGPSINPERVSKWVQFGGWEHSAGADVNGEGVYKSGPASEHGLGYRVGNSVGSPHWYRRASASLPHTLAAAVELADDLIREAVVSRLVADVPLGCLLSGGIDSALVAHYSNEHSTDLVALTMRMPESRYDESDAARSTAARLGVRHIVFDAEPTAAQDFVRLIRRMGVPFADSSILPTYWLCRGARRHVKVVLTGDGGDEVFGGYDRQRILDWSPAVLSSLRRLPLGAFDESHPRSKRAKMARLVRALRHGRYSELLAVFPEDDYRALFGASPTPRWSPDRIEWQAAKTIDRHQYLPWDLMRKADTASMAAGVEARAPFLARTVWETFAWLGERAPELVKRKRVLRALARRYLGNEIADRPKQGFAIPISDWWRTDFGGLGTLLFDSLDKPRPFGKVHDVLPINMDYVRQMIDEHWAAGGLSPKYTTRHVRKRDHGQRLFALVSLAIWAENLERNGQSQI